MLNFKFRHVIIVHPVHVTISFFVLITTGPHWLAIRPFAFRNLLPCLVSPAMSWGRMAVARSKNFVLPRLVRYPLPAFVTTHFGQSMVTDFERRCKAANCASPSLTASFRKLLVSLKIAPDFIIRNALNGALCCHLRYDIYVELGNSLSITAFTN